MIIIENTASAPANPADPPVAVESRPIDKRKVGRLADRITTFVKTPFDYSVMDGDTAERARLAVERIRQHHKNASIEIGRELLAMKEMMPHGSFLPWIETECGFSRRTAVNLMQTAAEFGDKWETVSHLPAGIIYQLASPSTPPEVREAVVRSSKAGEFASAGSVKAAIALARKPSPRRLSAEARRARDEEYERQRAADRQKYWDRIQAEENARKGAAGESARKAAQSVRAALGPAYAEFSAVVAKLKSEHHLEFLIEAFLAHRP